MARITKLAAQRPDDFSPLAGGTALALRLGHRLSRDFDFFNAQPFDEEVLLNGLKDVGNFSVVSKGRKTLHLHISGIKARFLGYQYPMLFPFESFLQAQIADAGDIACVKISAISGRGSKRDFVDLYVIAKRYGLAYLLDPFKNKYSQIDFNLVHALKSMTYFKDAEKEPMPKMLIDISWDEITEFFRYEALKLI